MKETKCFKLFLSILSRFDRFMLQSFKSVHYFSQVNSETISLISLNSFHTWTPWNWNTVTLLDWKKVHLANIYSFSLDSKYLRVLEVKLFFPLCRWWKVRMKTVSLSSPLLCSPLRDCIAGVPPAGAGEGGRAEPGLGTDADRLPAGDSGEAKDRVGCHQVPSPRDE